MIKRRFYKHEHGDRDVPSDSSSSSDSELEAEATDDSEEEEDDVVAEVRHDEQPFSSSSGYESEDSAGREVDLDSSGLPTNDDDLEAGNNRQEASEIHSDKENSAKIVDPQGNTEAEEDSIPSDMPDCVLKSKSVFKCKLCPRIVCLTEETLRAHLKSKRHSRSEKLLNEGRLKLMLNSDGEIEGETCQERRHASIVPSEQSNKNSDNSKRKNRGRQRQRMRVKKKKGEDSTLDKTKELAKNPAKKRRKK